MLPKQPATPATGFVYQRQRQATKAAKLGPTPKVDPATARPLQIQPVNQPAAFDKEKFIQLFI